MLLSWALFTHQWTALSVSGVIKGPAGRSDFFCLQFRTKRIFHAVTRIAFQKLCLFKASSRSSLVSRIVLRTSFVNLASASVSLLGSVRISTGQLSGSANHSGPFSHKLGQVGSVTASAPCICRVLVGADMSPSNFLYLAYSVTNKLLADTASAFNPM